jgi:hypothetical protein
MTDKLRRAKELAGQYLPKPGAATPAAGAPAAGAAPGTPAPKPVDTKRTALVKNLKANPAWQKTKAAKKAMADYGVTPEELK